MASPHTRGWTLGDWSGSSRDRGFPAHAGMDRRGGRRGGRSGRLPRTRGDGPDRAVFWLEFAAASPHTRGWTGLQIRAHPSAQGFPAHAGMDPSRAAGGRCGIRLPRTRGDGPRARRIRAPAPRASPHTRGWTSRCGVAAAPPSGFPAHAGMDPSASPRPSWARGLPRTRGDGPSHRASHRASDLASPHTRGWTRHRLPPRPRVSGFPAHAGMDPRSTPAPVRHNWLPRTRGDGPLSPARISGSAVASPHTRGWTDLLGEAPENHRGFPAHAGMDLLACVAGDFGLGLPRTRGDGPCPRKARSRGRRASPHTRGWTSIIFRFPPFPVGFPAHAGMDRP